MPAKKPYTRKPPVKQILERQLRELAQEANDWGRKLMQRLFAVTQDWEKFRSIVQNNYDLGLMHLKLGNLRDAILRFKFVVWLEPARGDAWYYLGCSYLADGNKALAKEALKKALKLKPGNEEIAYMLALAAGRSMPPGELPKRIPPALALEYFDGLAPGYGREQVETHQYRGHMLLCNAVRAYLVQGRIDHVILDLGVGTGLCGPLLRDVAAHITGVDFSGPMLAEAMKVTDDSGKKIYDALIKRELHEFLSEVAGEAFDIVLAAGVVSYIGDVQPVFAQVAWVLRRGGIFAFTADMAEGNESEFRFDPETGRFRYPAAYLRTLAAANGFAELKFEEAEIYPGYKAWLCAFGR